MSGRQGKATRAVGRAGGLSTTSAEPLTCMCALHAFNTSKQQACRYCLYSRAVEVGLQLLCCRKHFCQWRSFFLPSFLALDAVFSLAAPFDKCKLNLGFLPLSLARSRTFARPIWRWRRLGPIYFESQAGPGRSQPLFPLFCPPGFFTVFTISSARSVSTMARL